MSTLSTQRHRRRAIAAALAVATLTLAGCGTEQSTTPDATTESTPDATPTPTDDTETPAPITVAVPLYYAGDASGKVRLFREFQQVEGQALTEAARLVDGGEPLDPDYRTLWPGGAVESAEMKDGVITVTLKDDAFTERPDGMPEAEAKLALQQMVLTLQGVEQSTTPVRFVRTTGSEDESTPPTLFGIDVSKPVNRADWQSTMAMVNVTVPAQDSTVTGEELVAEGLASSFEANVPWEIRQGDKVVLTGYATADGWMDRLHPWHVEINISQLEPGEYTFVATTSDPSDGEGPGPTKDSKTFVVK